jgi:hypothetical protein
MASMRTPSEGFFEKRRSWEPQRGQAGAFRALRGATGGGANAGARGVSRSAASASRIASPRPASGDWVSAGVFSIFVDPCAREGVAILGSPVKVVARIGGISLNRMKRIALCDTACTGAILLLTIVGENPCPV